RPPARFGDLRLENGQARNFKEKPQTGAGWINGGFFVFEPAVFNLLPTDDTVLEGSPLETLSKEGQLMAYEHHGYWQCMDTLRDKTHLEGLWQSGEAPWLRL